MRAQWWLGLSLMVSGCGGSDGFKEAVPTRSTLSVNVPGSSAGSSTGTTGESQQALTGQRATFYTATRNVTLMFNGGVGGFLDGIEHILAQPPSAQSATHAVWGPSNDALATANYKFEIEKVAAQSYVYQFSAKLKGAPDSAYQAMVHGATQVVDAGHSTGDFHIDFDVARQFDDNTMDQSAITVHFDTTGYPHQLDIVFSKADASGTTSNDAAYAYTENADGGGTFQFVSPSDVNHDGTPETLAITSRWLASGQGRADVSATGGSLGGKQFGAVECWDTSFARSFYDENGDPATLEGDPKSCAF